MLAYCSVIRPIRSCCSNFNVLTPRQPSSQILRLMLTHWEIGIFFMKTWNSWIFSWKQSCVIQKIYLDLVPPPRRIPLLSIMGSKDLENVTTRLSILFISRICFYLVFLFCNFGSVLL